MDDRQTFDTVLQIYKDAYVQVGLGRQPETALADPRDRILQKISALKDLVQSESDEIKKFSSRTKQIQADTISIANDAKSLRTQVGDARDELTRSELVAKASYIPPPDYAPLYARLGAIGGFLAVAFVIRRLSGRPA